MEKKLLIDMAYAHFTALPLLLGLVGCQQWLGASGCVVGGAYATIEGLLRLGGAASQAEAAGLLDAYKEQQHLTLSLLVVLPVLLAALAASLWLRAARQAPPPPAPRDTPGPAPGLGLWSALAPCLCTPPPAGAGPAVVRAVVPAPSRPRRCGRRRRQRRLHHRQAAQGVEGGRECAGDLLLQQEDQGNPLGAARLAAGLLRQRRRAAARHAALAARRAAAQLAARAAGVQRGAAARPAAWRGWAQLARHGAGDAARAAAARGPAARGRAAGRLGGGGDGGREFVLLECGDRSELVGAARVALLATLNVVPVRR